MLVLSGLGEGVAAAEGAGPCLRGAAVRLREADSGAADPGPLLPGHPPPAPSRARVLPCRLLRNLLPHLPQGTSPTSLYSHPTLTPTVEGSPSNGSCTGGSPGSALRQRSGAARALPAGRHTLHSISDVTSGGC